MIEKKYFWSASDVASLLALAEETGERHDMKPIEAVRYLSELAAGEVGRASHARICRVVETMRRFRHRRNIIAGAPLFRDPAWDMLLDLYAAHEKGELVSVHGLCHASGVPASTALRHFNRLEESGMIEREEDLHDARRSWVRATQKALDAIEEAGALVVTAAGSPSRD